jgi:hypothetical protein
MFVRWAARFMRLFIPAKVVEVDVETPEPCPECGTTRRNKQDVKNGYCGRCHWFTFDPLMAEMWRRHWPERAAEAAKFKTLVRLGMAR